MARRTKTASETIGEQLAAARERLGLSLEDVSQRTKIDPRVVRALEEDQATKILSLVYARSFLRMYARFLGLDERPLLQEWVEQPAPTPVALPTMEPPSEPEPAPLPSITLPRISLPTLSLPRVTLPDWRTWLTWRPTQAQWQRAGKIALVLCVLWGGVGLLRWGAARTQRLSTAPTAASARQALSIPPREKLTLEVTAKEDTWLRVSADDKTVFQQTLAKGQVEAWDATTQLVLWITNAGGIELDLNGHALGVPGKRKEVIRELRITHQGLERRQ